LIIIKENIPNDPTNLTHSSLSMCRMGLNDLGASKPLRQNISSHQPKNWWPLNGRLT